MGKGTWKRAHNMTSRSPEHKTAVGLAGSADVGLLECSSGEIAYRLEKGLIKCLRGAGATLTNKTAGGGGVEGFVHSAEARRRISEGKKGDKNPMRRPEVAAKMALSQKPHRAAIALKVAETRRKPEVRKRASEVQLRSWADPVIRDRRLSALRASGAHERAAERFRRKNPAATTEGRELRREQLSIRWGADRESLVAAMRAAWTQERRERLSLNNPSHDPSVNAKKAAAMRGYKWPVVQCPHCPVVGAENIMKRWHFTKCKSVVGGNDAPLA